MIERAHHESITSPLLVLLSSRTYTPYLSDGSRSNSPSMNKTKSSIHTSHILFLLPNDTARYASPTPSLPPLVINAPRKRQPTRFLSHISIPRARRMLDPVGSDLAARRMSSTFDSDERTPRLQPPRWDVPEILRWTLAPLASPVPEAKNRYADAFVAFIKFNALPALNHSICSALKVWLTWMSNGAPPSAGLTSRASGFPSENVPRPLMDTLRSKKGGRLCGD